VNQWLRPAHPPVSSSPTGGTLIIRQDSEIATTCRLAASGIYNITYVIPTAAISACV
jgi:hypothetical protein